MSFYKASVDDIEKSIIESVEKNNSTRTNVLKSTIHEELHAIVSLARDQGAHLGRIGAMKDWEVTGMPEETASYALKLVKKLKSKRIIRSDKIDLILEPAADARKSYEGSDMLWDD